MDESKFTFNRRITEGVQNGTIEEVEYCGVRVYLVVPPQPGEEVVEYVTFSGWQGQHTPTQLAGGDDK